MASQPQLYLASRSLQRSDLLKQLGISFELVHAQVEELIEGSPAQLASKNAEKKLDAAIKTLGEFSLPVLAADTVIDLDGKPLGKPSTKTIAESYLRQLSGRTHKVVTAVAVAVSGRKKAVGFEVTEVRFRDLDEQTVQWYLDLGEWVGRAGGYAIQLAGTALVESIKGNYTNVVGLPIPLVIELLPGHLFSSSLKR